jgi:hypothetical protein
MLRDLFQQHWPPPIVVGGTGGSGTRLVARLLRETGVALGARVNAAEDALAFVPLYDRYVNAYLENGAIDMAAFEADLLRAIRDHLDPAAARAWGWKNPRSIYLLPLLDQVIPGLRFVHVIRHGLDMAASANRNQWRLHGRAALGTEHAGLSPEAGSALLWKQVNETAADYGRSMRGRYFLLRYEDVCAGPGRALAPLAAALGLEIPAGGWKEAAAPPAPRRRSLDAATLGELRSRIGDALERFGYTC